MKIVAISTRFKLNSTKKRGAVQSVLDKSTFKDSNYISFKNNRIINQLTESKAFVFDSVFSLIERKHHLNFNWNDTDKGIKNHIADEVEEYTEGIQLKDANNMVEEIGDVIHIIVRWMNNHKINPAKAIKYSFLNVDKGMSDKSFKHKIIDSVDRFIDAINKKDDINKTLRAGDLLKYSQQWARKYNVNPLYALSESVKKINSRLDIAELEAKNIFKTPLKDLPKSEQLVSWEKAKKIQKANL